MRWMTAILVYLAEKILVFNTTIFRGNYHPPCAVGVIIPSIGESVRSSVYEDDQWLGHPVTTRVAQRKQGLYVDNPLY